MRRLGTLLSNPTRIAIVRAITAKPGLTHPQLRELIGLSHDRYGIHLTWLVETKLVVKAKNDAGDDVFSVDEDVAIQFLSRMSEVFGLHTTKG